jgi:hypothetical protein
MWECARCHATCDDDAKVCESCGSSREGRADADFKFADEIAAGLANEEGAADSAAVAGEARTVTRRSLLTGMLVGFVLVLAAYGYKWLVAGFAPKDLGWLVLPLALARMPWQRTWTRQVACALTVLLSLLIVHDFFGLLWSSGPASGGNEAALTASSRAILCAWHLITALWLCAGVIVTLRLAKLSAASERTQ